MFLMADVFHQSRQIPSNLIKLQPLQQQAEDDVDNEQDEGVDHRAPQAAQ